MSGAQFVSAFPFRFPACRAARRWSLAVSVFINRHNEYTKTIAEQSAKAFTDVSRRLFACGS